MNIQTSEMLNGSLMEVSEPMKRLEAMPNKHNKKKKKNYGSSYPILESFFKKTINKWVHFAGVFKEANIF